MSVNYPSNPTNGQEFKIGNKTLVWDSEKTKWVPSIRNYYQYGTELTTTGPTLNVDLSKSNLFSINLTEQAVLSFINPPTTGSYAFTVKVKNDNVIIEDGTTSNWDIRNMTTYTNYPYPTNMDTSMTSFAVSPDGKKSFFIGFANDRVYQLDMNQSAPWNFGSGVATYNGVFLPVGNTFAGELTPLDLYVDITGTNLFICGTALSTIFRYILPNPWSLSDASTTPVSSFAPGITTNALFFKPDGTVLYVLDSTNKVLYQYPLTGPSFDITQRGTAISKPITIETSVNYFRFKPDGTKLYISGQTNEYMYQYNLATPWDISTISFDAISGKMWPASIVTGGFVTKPEGDYLYFLNRTNSIIQANSLTSFTLSNTLTWPSNIIWQNNVAPELPENQKTSIYEFTTVDGGSTYHGKIIINNV